MIDIETAAAEVVETVEGDGIMNNDHHLLHMVVVVDTIMGTAMGEIIIATMETRDPTGRERNANASVKVAGAEMNLRKYSYPACLPSFRPIWTRNKKRFIFVSCASQ